MSYLFLNSFDLLVHLWNSNPYC